MAIPVINVYDTKQIIEAMRKGIVFRLKSEETLYNAMSETEAARQELIAFLSEAEKCTEYVTREEFWAGVEK